MATTFQFNLLIPELQLNVIDHLPFEDAIHLRMTSRKYHSFILKPSHQQLLAAEQTDWAIGKDLFACCYCLQLRLSTKFSETMISKKRARGRGRASMRFCIECGLSVPWKNLSARGYSRGNRIRVKGKDYEVCKNCGLTKKVDAGGWPYRPCPHGFQSNRKRKDLSSDLTEWRLKYKLVLEEIGISPERAEEIRYYDIEDTGKEKYYKLWDTRRLHGLPISCL
jgi:hypothetical protein